MMKKRIGAALLAGLMMVSSVPVMGDTPQTTATVLQHSAMENNNQDQGVVLHKSSTVTSDGYIDINIEAYTTGTVTTDTKVTPADIVLVLDTSGSMEDGEETVTTYKYEEIDGTKYTYTEYEWWQQFTYDAYGFNNQRSYYIDLGGGNYQQVSRSGRDENGFDYYRYGSYGNRTYVYPKLDSEPSGVTRENNYGVHQFYTRTVESTVTTPSKIDLLKDGVNAFIEETLESNKDSEGNVKNNPAEMHSIAIVRFSSEAEVERPLTTVGVTGAADLKDAVEDLQPDGATAVDYGLNAAKGIFDAIDSGNDDNHRNQIVIVFTDGEPNHYSGYDADVAADAVNIARDLKAAGVTVFSISVAPGANAADITSNINRFMHYLSSNFPNAYASGNDTLYDGLASNTTVPEAMARGYYQTPDQEMNLSSIFEGIASTIGKPSIELGTGASVVDTISPYFTIPNGVSDIRLATVAKTASGWDVPQNADGVIVTLQQGGHTFRVDGFDFDANYVSETVKPDGTYGKKLIISFRVTPNYEQMDQNAAAIAAAGGKISTNQGSAALNDSTMTPVATVDSPTLQAHKVTYRVDGVEYKTVYRFETADVELIEKPADTAAVTYGNWESKDVTIANNGFTMPGKDVVIELTGAKNEYTVKYVYLGTEPENAPAPPASSTHYYNDTVYIAADPNVEGYTFVGWGSEGADALIRTDVAGKEYIVMPARNVTLEGTFVPNTGTGYKVEHYKEQNDGTYLLAETTSHSGTTGATVTAIPLEYPGYSLNRDVSASTISGNIQANGSLVLKLYYDLDPYTVTYTVIGDIIPEKLKNKLGENNRVYSQKTYTWDEQVSVLNDLSYDGYIFAGWKTDDVTVTEGKFTMPMYNVDFVGEFIKEKANYEVNHYLADANGTTYTPYQHYTRTGDVGEYVTASFLTFDGFTGDTQKSNTTGVVISNKNGGGLVLNLYYNRNKHTVSYEIKNAPTGVETPTGGEFVYGADVTVAEKPSAEGYTFYGWYTDNANLNGSSFRMPNNNVLLEGYFEANGDIGYTVEHYLEIGKEDGASVYATEPAKTEHHTGKTDDEVTASPEAFRGYKYNQGISEASGKITGDGKLVLKLYYDRVSYNVTYEIVGDVSPTDIIVPETETHPFGSTVKVADDYSITGYTFTGWTTSGAQVSNGSFIMPAQDVHFTGRFVIDTSGAYKVHHYMQNTDGEWPDDANPTHALTYTGVQVGKEVTARTDMEYPHFELYLDHEKTVCEGTVDKDGTLLLKIYYKRTQYTVEYHYENDPVPDGANALLPKPNPQTYYYNQTVDVEDVPVLEGYTFVGWGADKADVIIQEGTGNNRYFVMPGRNVLLHGLFIPASGTVYKVEHYLENPGENGTYTLETTTDHAGTTDSLVYAVPGNFEGYSWNRELHVDKQSGRIKADGSLVLELYYDKAFYNVSYTITGTIPTGATVPGMETHDYSDTVDVAAHTVVPGYTFVGWTTSDVTVENGEFTMPAKDVAFTGYYTADLSQYKVEHYQQNIDNPAEYTLKDEEYENATVGDLVTAKFKQYEGFIPRANNQFTGIVQPVIGEQMLVIKLYYDRLSAKVTYIYTGDIPENAPDLPAEATYVYGDEVTVAETPELEGYAFNGWNTHTAKVESGKFSMPAHNVVLSGEFISTASSYTVEHYLQKLDGSWADTPDETRTFGGHYGDVVTANYLDFTGFTPCDHINTVESGAINADEPLVLKLYYKRDSYTVTYTYDNAPAGAPELPEEQTYLYGETVSVEPDAELDGYIFSGWTTDDANVEDGVFTMPAKDVVLVGSFREDDDDPIIPIIPDMPGHLTIMKTLDAPAGFPKQTFTFDIYSDYGRYVNTVEVEANESETIRLAPGAYYIYETDAEVDGYTLFTKSDVKNNRIIVRPSFVTVARYTNTYYATLLETEDHFAYIIGYPDGTVQPEANITRAEVATIFFRMLTDGARELYWSKENPFSDVSSSDWFNNAISTLTNAGVLNGYPDGTFNPNGLITRAELVKIAVSFYGTTAGAGTHFADASAHWAEEFIAAAEEFGFVDGYEDGTFRPDRFVTRAEAMKIINRTLDRNPHKDQLLDDMIEWPDNQDTTEWYYADVQEATNSHTYYWDAANFEVWDALLPVRDWAALEKEWSDARAD